MNALVAYFSASGTTAKAAKVLAKAADADLYEIKPAVPYTRRGPELDGQALPQQRGDERQALPPGAGRPGRPHRRTRRHFPGFSYLVVYGTHHHQHLLESYDFTGKTIVLFATSGGSGLGRSAEACKASAPGARFWTVGCSTAV